MVVNPGASPPDPHAFGGTGSFCNPPKKRCDAPPTCTRHHKTQYKMRFHAQSPFGKAWAAHFKAANLARLSDEEKRVEYNRFSTEWDQKMGRGTTPPVTN